MTSEYCPRCRDGPFASHRALSIHLHSCRLLFAPQTDESPQKRTHATLTIAQRAEHIFNSIKRQHISGNRPNINRLSVNPVSAYSTSSSVTNNDTDVNVDYDGPDFGTDADCPIIDESSTNTHDPYHFHHNLNPPPGIKFGIHLQHILSSHRGVDLKLYDEIIDLIKMHGAQDNNFSTSQLYHRNELTKNVAKLYNLTELQPRLHNVTLSDSSVVSVSVFDVKAVILSMLNDSRRMQQIHFASGYDIFTGHTMDDTNTYLNEIHTGALWKLARNYYCRGVDNAFPLALLCFYDKTHTDLHGALSCAPFIVTFSFFNERARARDNFYRVLGYIPNLSYGLGKSNSKDPQEKLNDEHRCLHLITDQICELAQGFEATVLGRTVTIKPWIHFIAGDTSGHNNLVGQFNSSNATIPYRDCCCMLSQMSDPIPQCHLITVNEYNVAKKNGDLAGLGLHDIDNAFDRVPFGNVRHGIFGSVPAEMLHVSGNGIMQYQLDVIHEIISSGQHKRKTLHSLDILHQNLVHFGSQQSERDMPRTSDRNGVTDGTKMSASERVGNMFLLLCAMHTKQGRELFADGCYNSGVSLRQIQDCIKLQLGFEKWVDDSNTIAEVERATDLVAELINRIKISFPRTAGNQWNIPKMHSLSKMIHYMLQFGKAKNFSGQTGERVLKSIVKDHAQRTQRRVNTFASQVANREFEAFVLEYAFDDIRDLLGEDYCRKENVSSDGVFANGQYTMYFTACDSRGRGDCKVYWHSRTRNELEIAINDMVTHALRTYAMSQEWMSEFVVHGFTSAHLAVGSSDNKLLFHANPYVYGGERYHFCMVQFYDDRTNNVRTCPARIMAFVQFKTKTFPVPDDAQNALYAIVHTAREYLSWQEIEKSFVSPFILGDMKSCVYIVNTNNISDPLFVCPNYGQDGSHFLCCLPYRRWGSYFRYQLNRT